jgi:hypothetical protein
MSELRPDRCPVCGGPNDCGMAAGKSECWCASVKISAEALEKVPEGAKGNVCVCANCARIASAPVHTRITECIAALSPDSTATVDPDFAKDVEAGINAHRESLEPPSSD